jgi:hypothetical protein
VHGVTEGLHQVLLTDLFGHFGNHDQFLDGDGLFEFVGSLFQLRGAREDVERPLSKEKKKKKVSINNNENKLKIFSVNPT